MQAIFADKSNITLSMEIFKSPFSHMVEIGCFGRGKAGEWGCGSRPPKPMVNAYTYFGKIIHAS